MAIRNLTQVYCSLNLGLIYNMSYDWSPQSGSTVSLFFVKQDGNYTRPRYMQKAQIRIGNASFSMYVVASDIQLSSGRRVMEVSFMDDTFELENYEVIPTGKGCGFNVFPLGSPVDTRTEQEKQDAALDSTAQQIAEFTTFSDVEYTFNDFLTILRQKFNVQIVAFYDESLTAPVWGSFRSVLDGWCALFNLSWFIENGIIKIFDPTTLSLQLPTQPTDAIAFNDSEDVRDTYGKTVYNWFQQEGGEYPLNQTSNEDGDLLVRTNTLFPVGYEMNLVQTPMNLNQVAAAQYGEEFWFLYNYFNGTLSECGWTTMPMVSGVGIYQSAAALGASVASVDPVMQAQKFEAYKTYGEQIAGRWYLSNAMDSLAVDTDYQWFDESQGQIFTFTDVDDKTINLDFLTPTSSGPNVIPNTSINVYYSGVNYVGNRVVYRDDYSRQLPLSLTSDDIDLVNNTYSAFQVYGSVAADYSQLTPKSYVMYNPVPIPTELQSTFGQISAVAESLAPRFTSVPIKGITRLDYSTLKASQSEQDGAEIDNNNNGGTVVSNTSVIKTQKGGAYTVYYNKYSKCASAHSTGPYFGHKIIPRQISVDNEINVTFSKQAGNVYNLNRDYSTINALVNNPLLQSMAQPRSFLTHKVSFTVNYFYDVPGDFLTNGLVGMSMSIGDRGVTASYSYSNEILAVPTPDKQFATYEQSIKNSTIRRYTPTTVIS